MKVSVLEVEKNNDYLKFLRYADEEYKQKIDGYLQRVKEKARLAKLEEKYLKAAHVLLNENTEEIYLEAASLLVDMEDYKDSRSLQKQLHEKAEEARKEKEARLEQARREAEYNAGLAAMQGARTSAKLYGAIQHFEAAQGWEDSEKLISKCRDILIVVQQKENKEKQEIANRARAAQQKADWIRSGLCPLCGGEMRTKGLITKYNVCKKCGNKVELTDRNLTTSDNYIDETEFLGK